MEIIEIYEQLGYPMERYYDRVGKTKLILGLYKHVINSPHDKVRILDIGGGWGYDLMVLKKYIDSQRISKNVELLLVDKYLENSTDSTFKNSKKFSDITYFEDDFTLFSPEDIGGRVDIIFSAETIEHVWDIEKELWFIKMNELLKIGGSLFITAPNGASLLKNMLGVIKRNNRSILCSDFDAGISHHKGVPTLYECLSLFMRKGFQIEKFSSTTFSFELRYSLKNSFFQTLFSCLPFNYLFSSSIVYESRKTAEIDTHYWYNKKENLVFLKA